MWDMIPTTLFPPDNATLWCGTLANGPHTKTTERGLNGPKNEEKKDRTKKNQLKSKKYSTFFLLISNMKLSTVFKILASLSAIYFKSANSQDSIDPLTGLGSEEIVSNLLEATSQGDLDGVISAIDAGEDINTLNVNGWSGAAFAAAEGNIDILRVLIDAEIDLNLATDDGYTPLMLAALQVMTSYIIDANISLCLIFCPGFFSSVCSLSLFLFFILLNQSSLDFALTHVSLQSDKEIVDLLLEGNADPLQTTPAGLTAYSIALESKRMIVAATILEACVIRGMVNDDIDTVMQGVKDGAYINIRTSGGWNPLIFATAGGYHDSVKELLALGANANHVDNDGWSPLHFAASNGFEDIVTTLLKAGGDPQLETEAGLTPSAVAVNESKLNVAKLIDDFAAGQDL